MNPQNVHPLKVADMPVLLLARILVGPVGFEPTSDAEFKSAALPFRHGPDLVGALGIEPRGAKV